MERLYKQYLTLTAGQRKLLCFLAYTGKDLDSDLISLYAKCEDIYREEVKKAANTLTQYLRSYSFYREDYQLGNYHVAPLYLYMLKEMPQWGTHFDTFYKRLQAPDYFMLLSSNYVIHLDPWWNPAIEQQATDRAYRIGQRQNVTVYHLISQHTIEEKILRLHETKRNLADAMLEGTSESHKLNASDLLGMLDAASSSGTS